MIIIPRFFAIIKCDPLSRHRFQNTSHPGREKPRISIPTGWFHPALILRVIESASRQNPKVDQRKFASEAYFQGHQKRFP